MTDDEAEAGSLARRAMTDALDLIASSDWTTDDEPDEDAPTIRDSAPKIDAAVARVTEPRTGDPRKGRRRAA